MKNRYSIILLLGIFLLAAALRMGWGGVNLFASDEARLSLVALDMARQGDIARMGIQSSAGTRNLPASVYAFLPPYWISSDPLLASMYVGLLNALSIVGIGWLLYRVSGRNAALVAMLWLALNPTAVSYARSIWTQNLLMPLTTAWLLTAYLAIVTKKPRWRDALIALNLFIAGTAFQVHLAGASLILAALYVVLRFGWWRHWWAIIAGGIAAFLLLAPFLYHAQCCAPELVSEYFSAVGGDARAVDTQAAQFTLQIALGADWAYSDNNDIALTVPLLLAGLVLVVGGVGLFVRSPHPLTPSPNSGRGDSVSPHPPNLMTTDSSEKRSAVSPSPLVGSTLRQQTEGFRVRGLRLLLELALVLLIATIAMFTYHSTPVRLHYMLGALPAIAVLIGIGCAAYRKPLNYLTAAPVIILSILWLAQMLPPLNQLQIRIEPGSAGSLLAAPRTVAQSIPADLPIVVHSASDDATTRGEPATWRVLLYDRPARVVNGWNMLVLPPEPTMLLSEDAAMPAWEELNAAGLLGDVQMLTPVENMATYYLMRYDGTAQSEGFNWLESPVRFADGLELRGWKMRRVGDRLRVSMVYHVEALPAPATYQQFAHLRDAATLDTEQPLLVTDVALSQPNWRVDDTLIVMADFFPQAPATFWVDIGHYTLEQLGRIPRSDGAGDTIRLGSFDWH